MSDEIPRKHDPDRDACELCDGTQGTPGNENIIEGVVVCDYCSVQYRKALELAAERARCAR